MFRHFQTPPLIKKMLFVFIGCFVLQGLMSRFLIMNIHDASGLAPIPIDPFLSIVGLVPNNLITKGYVWQLVTYMFFHGGLAHLLFNMFAFWMFGSELCAMWRNKRFLTFFFACGIGAGVFHVLTSYIFFANDIRLFIPTIGASGAIYGILMAYGLLFGNRLVLLFFFIPMKARTLVFLVGGIEIFYSITQSRSGIAHLAHLGGMLVGLLMIKSGGWWHQIKMHRYQKSRQKLKDRIQVIIDNSEDVDRSGHC